MFEVNEAGVVSCNGASKEVDDDINCSIPLPVIQSIVSSGGLMRGLDCWILQCYKIYDYRPAKVV